ncbi:unnamed protein product [Ilex paraguariensis]|uniref:GrpE protein homolog n=1 Tax=Ilex paraguariensis TaxID=185542 RepID=A0ABC8T388_9AQUA
MFIGRVSSRLSRNVLTQCRNSLLLYARQEQPFVPISSNQFHSLRDLQNNVVTCQVSLLHHSILNTSAIQRFGFSSSASPQSNDKDTSQPGNEQGSTVENSEAATKPSGDAEVPDQTDQKESGSSTEPNSTMSQSVKRRRRGTKRTAFSDSDSDLESELSRDDLVKLVAEKEELLNVKVKEIEQLKDKVLRTYAEMENVMERTRREAENAKKYAIQNFAKSLLDVADNLSRASSVVKESFSKIDASKETVGAVPLLKTLLEGVEMTEKQLAEAFKKFGVERYDPTNEQFDPHRHNAVFQVPDPSKPPGTVAVVLKPGYILFDRILRPAEVGVTVDNKDADEV